MKGEPGAAGSKGDTGAKGDQGTPRISNAQEYSPLILVSACYSLYFVELVILDVQPAKHIKILISKLIAHKIDVDVII